MPRKKISQLHHACKFVKKENPAIKRQTPMITGDVDVCKRSSHFEPYLTKSEVRIKHLQQFGTKGEPLRTLLEDQIHGKAPALDVLTDDCSKPDPLDFIQMKISDGVIYETGPQPHSFPS